jgi:transaldolase
VNTVPPATYAAILDHATVAATIEQRLDVAKDELRRLEAGGIDMAAVMRELEEEGVVAFEKSFDGLAKYLSALT